MCGFTHGLRMSRGLLPHSDGAEPPAHDDCWAPDLLDKSIATGEIDSAERSPLADGRVRLHLL